MTGAVGATRLAHLREGGKRAMATALSAIELDRAEDDALLDAAWADPRGVAIGVTGPPGVGKSSLINALIRRFRADRASVGVIAVDPSSAKSGGALLGDRARFSVDPTDAGVFTRSMAARDWLGGLSRLAFPAATLMRAVYDLVLIETVGVGQSEAEIAGVADAVVLCLQPASGDALQFMKAGIMEIPDLALVTKADLGEPARRAAAEARSALSHAAGSPPEVILVSAETGDGLDQAAATMRARARVDASARAEAARRWIDRELAIEFGRIGADAAGRLAPPAPDRHHAPFAWRRAVSAELSRRIAGALDGRAAR